MRKNILIVCLSLVLLALIYFIATYKESGFKKVDLDIDGIKVYNTTDTQYLDSIVYVGLNELNIHGVVVVIRPLLKEVSQDDRDIRAHIVAADSNYVIFTGKYSRQEAIKIICHELIHLQQYHSGRLIIKNGMVTWQGTTEELDSWMQVSYIARPWEAEAFQEQGKLSEKVSKVLYE